MDLGIKGKVALITGGSKGIGKAAAEALAKEGCNIVICARNEKELKTTAAELQKHGTEVLAVPADMTNEKDIQQLVQQAADQFGSIDILVNNAGGIGSNKPFDELSTQDWRDLFELNLFSVATITRLVHPYMKKNGWGRIINISSENGVQPYPDMSLYNVTKGALDNLSKTLSKLYADDGILVNTVAPAFIKTPLVEGMMQQQAEQQGTTPEKAEKHFLKENRPSLVLKRSGTVEETGAVIAFLASERASFITGSIYRVDGGSVATV